MVSSSLLSLVHLTGRILELNAAEATPMPLFVAAANVPATWVPCEWT